MRCIVTAMSGVVGLGGIIGLGGITAIALLSASASGAGTQPDADVYVHGLSLDGRVSVNGTSVTRYDRRRAPGLRVAPDAIETPTPEGDFVDPIGDVFVEDHGDLWSALVADGADRYALRRDGRVRKNDVRLFDLPSADSPWLDMTRAFGTTFAIRADGVLAIDDQATATLPTGPFHFRRVVSDRRNSYSLRSDGSVFRNAETLPSFAFRAGTDGSLRRTTWIAAAIDPSLTFLYALRSDGVVKRGLLFRDPLNENSRFGETVAALPFELLAEPPEDQLFVDLEFAADGIWFVLSADGRVFSRDSTALPIATLPNTVDGATAAFTDLELLGTSNYALRADGHVYVDNDPSPFCRLPSAKHGALAVSQLAPILAKGDSKRPQAARLKTKVTAGSPLLLPVVVSDIDTCDADLVVTPVSVPDGATWSGSLRALVWTSPGPPGRHVFRFVVSDGERERNVAYRIRVKERDVDPNENARPLTPEFGTLPAVATEELAFPLIVDDPDGDLLQVTVDPRRYPFTAGATFDEATRTFRWTPTADDCGTTTVRFFVTDGRSRGRNVQVRIRVKDGLFYASE